MSLDSNVRAQALMTAVTLLAESRMLLAGGKIENARGRYRRVERYLPMIVGKDKADDLLTVWEGSLETNPLDLEEFQTALKDAVNYDLNELRKEMIVNSF